MWCVKWVGVTVIAIYVSGCSSVQVQRTATSESLSWRSLKDAEVLMLPVAAEDHHMYVPVSTDTVVPLVERHLRRSTLVLDVPRADPNYGGSDDTGYWAIVREAGETSYDRESMEASIHSLLGDPEEDFAVLVRTIKVKQDQKNWEDEDDEGTEKEYWENTAYVTVGVYLIDLSDGTLAWFAEGTGKVSNKNQVTRWEEADGNFLKNLLHNLFFRPIEGTLAGEKEGYPNCPIAEATRKTLDKLLDGMPH